MTDKITKKNTKPKLIKDTRKSKKISKQSTTKDKKSIESIQKIKDNIDELIKSYEDTIFDVNTTDKELNKLLNKIEKLQIKLALSEDNNLYPNILNPSFSKLLSLKKEYAIFEIPDNKEKVKKLYDNIHKPKVKDDKKVTEFKDIWKLSPTQNALRNFMSPETPYNGLLVVHGTGVGKSCSAITIAEQLKEITNKNNKKIYILPEKDFRRQIFEINKFKKGEVNNQCTGDTYIEKIRKIYPEIVEDCERDTKNCGLLENRIKKAVEKYYSFETGYDSWAKKAKANYTKKKASAKDALKYKIENIRKNYSNSIMIIDEAHHINTISNDNKEEAEGRLVINVLTDILKYSINLKLILLTATPMFDKPDEIVSLLNFLLINDKRPTIKSKDIFDKGNLISDAKELLIQKSRGYVSYLRGNNPFDFPIKLSAKLNFPKKIYNFDKKIKIPSQFTSSVLNDDYKLQYLDLVDCPMEGVQKDIYNRKMESKSTSFSWIEETIISNFVYQSFDESKNNIKMSAGSKGLKSVIRERKGNQSYRFKDEEYGKRFLLENLSQYSSKIATLISIINETTKNGPVFIYSEFIAGGIIPIIFALEMNGYRQWKSYGNPNLENKYKSSEYRGDYIIKSGGGEIESTPGVNKYLDKRQNMIDEPVKVFIGTKTVAEGFSLFGYREVHILEPWFNLSRNEQVIGRIIRTGSHNHLDFANRNVTVYQYAATNNKIESVDLYKYRISESKAITSGKIMNILKENAIDCYLNKNGNVYDEKLLDKPVKINTSLNKTIEYYLYDKPYTSECNYQSKCAYKCISNKLKDVEYVIDDTTFNIKHIMKEINRVALEIEKLTRTMYIIKKTDIIKYVRLSNIWSKDNHNINELIVNGALIKVLDNRKILEDKKGVSGIIKEYGKFIKFIPVNNKDINIEYVHQYFTPTKKIEKIDLKLYIDKLVKEINKEQAKKTYGYEKILLKFQDDFDNIKYKTELQEYEFTINITDLEILEFLLQKQKQFIKLEIMKTLVKKSINGEDMTSFEKNLFNIIKKNNVIYLKDLDYEIKDTSRIFGFVIATDKDLDLYSYNTKKNELVKDVGNQKKVKLGLMTKFKKQNINSITGFLKQQKGRVVFKILDISLDDKKSRTGSRCDQKARKQILYYIKTLLGDKYPKKTQIRTICNDLEMAFRQHDGKDKKRWFLSPEEYILYSS